MLWTRTIKKVIEDHEELDVQTFTAKILCDVQRRLQPTRKEAETDLTTDSPMVRFYGRTSWRGMFWAALFIVCASTNEDDRSERSECTFTRDFTKCCPVHGS